MGVGGQHHAPCPYGKKKCIFEDIIKTDHVEKCKAWDLIYLVSQAVTSAVRNLVACIKRGNILAKLSGQLFLNTV